jgi:twinkle protein
MPSSTIASTADGPVGRRLGELTERHQTLLEARGFDVELLSMLGVESISSRAGDWIAIPYRVGGAVVNCKYRTIAGEKRFCQEAGARKAFWNFDSLADATLRDQPAIVTEGEFDAMAAMQAGFQRVVSVPDGAPAEPVGEAQGGSKYEYLAEALPHLHGAREIVLAVDNDQPGVNLLNDLAIRFGRGRCKWVVYPEGCKDLADVLAKHGEAGVVRVIRAARYMRVSGVYRMSELPPVNDPQAYDCGLPLLGLHYRLRRSDLCVVTGIPGHGKSTFANEVACRMSRCHGWNTAFASFEQYPQIDHRRALRTWFCGKGEDWQRPGETAAADAWIDRHFGFIVPEEGEDATLAWLLERMAAAVVQHNASLVVVDPWNEMDHDRPRDMSPTEYVGFAIRQFKRFARNYNVHLVVVAHPTKMQRKQDGTLPVPTLYDISDSANWFNKPDVGIVIHRESDGDTLVKVAKSRYHDRIGKPGQIRMFFNEAEGRFLVREDRAA